MYRIGFSGLRKRFLRPAMAGVPALGSSKTLFIDRAVYFVGVTGFIMTVPQITKIWVDQNASGVSMLSWCAYLLSAATWLIYGIIHRRPQMIFLYSVWIILEAIIVVGLVKYG